MAHIYSLITLNAGQLEAHAICEINLMNQWETWMHLNVHKSLNFAGISFFSILGRGYRAFLIGYFNSIKTEIEKFDFQVNNQNVHLNSCNM